MCYIAPSSVLYKQDNERLYKMNKDRILVNEETENLKDKMLPETEIKEKNFRAIKEKLQHMRDVMVSEAAFYGDTDLLEAFHVDGVDLSGKFTEIGSDIIKSHVLIEGFFKKGINLATWQDENGRNLIHHVAMSKTGKISSISALVKVGVDINAQDKDGNTPLHMIAMNKYRLDMCQKLVLSKVLECGAVLNIRNNRGLTPSEEATMSLNRDAYILIKAHEHGKRLKWDEVCIAHHDYIDRGYCNSIDRYKD